MNNTIVRNIAYGSGGGISCDRGAATIANNMIAYNSGYTGGGICFSSTSAVVVNNTIVRNCGSLEGGGICCYFDAPTITNTIIAFNTSGIHCYQAPASMRYNCVYGNGVSNYSGMSDLTGISGNVSVDPRLADVPNGNLHIQADSPCINAGDGGAVPSGWTDIDGHARILDGSVDIGADECDGTTWSAAPMLIVRVSPTGNDANDGSSWASAKRTVQAGMDAVAGSEGEVWVQAGTYQERVTLPAWTYVYGGFAGTETQRSERDWSNHVTTLDGSQGGAVVTATGINYSRSVIDGFTIRNGQGTAGGVHCDYSSPTISNNTITGNNGGSYGGGISCWYSSPTITRNTISNNVGAGIFCDCSSPTVTNNTISGNYATYGGGIDCTSSYPLTIVPAPMIANNMIVGNGATYGGGISSRFSSPAIRSNTIAGNSGSYGAGIYAEASYPKIINSIIAFNSSGLCFLQSGVVTFQYNCVYGNTAYNYSGIGNMTGGNGNISVDPKFAGLSCGNAHLQPGSPCINAGESGLVMSGWPDTDGQERILQARVDIGADESDGTSWPAAPYTIVRVSPVGNDANNGSSWALAKRTVQAGIDAAAATGGEVWVQEGTYAERVVLPNFVYLYGGFAGTETVRSARDRLAHVTVLDGGQNGSVVTTTGSGYGLSAIDGFVIRNGKADAGGGIDCNGGSPMIANNTITGNSARLGGAIHCVSPCATIVNNTIASNSAEHGGGGILIEDSTATIIGNRITGNIAGNSVSRGGGGGISCTRSVPIIGNNTLIGNSASDSGGGIGSYVSSPTIRNNILLGNTAPEGGGICVYSYAESFPSAVGTIANCTIAGNSASAGGGVWINESAIRISNTIVAFNSSGICNWDTYYGYPQPLSFCCVYGNTSYDYTGILDPAGTPGNISVDPLFYLQPGPGADGQWCTADDVCGDVHLRATSPCIRAGDPAYLAPAGQTDMDGLPRVIDRVVDIGAYERPMPGDINSDGRVNVGDLQLLVAAWASQADPPTSNWNINADVNNDGYVNVGDLQPMVANWGRVS